MIICTCCKRSFHESLSTNIEYRGKDTEELKPLCLKCANLPAKKHKTSGRGSTKR